MPEIILVDNQSADGTLKVAKEFHVNKILKIKEFLPGKAINRGIKASKGEKVIIVQPLYSKWKRLVRKSYKISK